MSALVAFVAAHWLAVSLGVYALVSDAMPFLPTRYNGVAHAILGGVKWLIGQFAPAALPKDGAK